MQRKGHQLYPVWRYNVKRIITSREEEAYRLCHHEFDGMSTADAAIHLGVTRSRVQQLLASVRRKAPHLFPILNKTEATIYTLLTHEGLTVRQIAEQIDMKPGTVRTYIKRMRKKGASIPDGRGCHGRPLELREGMMDKIVEKF